ncbi:MAG: molybdopterin-dependent oxidoreductase [Gudongella sp.]|nr:molybdopterin-dependent oxidoreductase [Gudongella sp.]
MKRKISILLVFLLAFAVIFTACKKQDELSENVVDNPDEIVQEVEQEPEEAVIEEDAELEQEVVTEEESLEEEQVIETEVEAEEPKAEEPKAEEPKQEEPKVEEAKPEEVEVEQPEPVDERENTLKVQGKVNTELSLSLAELQSFTDIGFSGTFYSLNSFGTTDHTDFKGVNLWLLLKNKAGILDSATTVKVIAVDGYEMQFSIAQIKRADYIDETDQDVKLPVVIAWQENGEDYSINDGPPYKLVIGQKEPGDVNKPQWVSNIDKIIVE